MIILNRKAFDLRLSNTNQSSYKLTDIHGTKVVAACNLYFTCLKTITQLKLDILTGIFNVYLLLFISKELKIITFFLF